MKGKDLIKFITENKLENSTVHFLKSSCDVLTFGQWYAADTNDPDDTIEYAIEKENDTVYSHIELYRDNTETFKDLTTEEALRLRKSY
jgi:hypothetical protein